MTNELIETPYGFKWGPMEVQRTATDPKYGYILLIHSKGGGTMQVRVSPKGRSIMAWPVS